MGHHVPLAVTAGLRLRGVDVLTCHEDGTSDLDDAPLLERATELGRVLFSQDVDLLVVAKEWQEVIRKFLDPIWISETATPPARPILDLGEGVHVSV